MRRILLMLALCATAASCGQGQTLEPLGQAPDRAAAPVSPAMQIAVPAADDTPKARRDFLKLIDRPKVPAAVQIAAPRTTAGVAEYSFSYASDAADRVPGILITSDKPAAGRRPVVIALHGTGGKKEDERALLTTLANRGFIGVAIDGPFHGARAAAAPKEGGLNAYETAVLNAWHHPESNAHPFFIDTVWDVMRLVDYLQTRDDVDATRIGMYGVSKGGIETYLSAAVDPRIAAAVPCISVESFQWALDNDLWQHRIETIQKPFDIAAKEAGLAKPGPDFVAKFYDRICPGINGEFDGPAMVPLIAPRPLMAINGEKDLRTPPASLKLCTDAAAAAYRAAGAEDRLVVRIQPNTAHQVRPESQAAAVEFFVKWLQPH